MEDETNLAKTPKYSQHHLFWPPDMYKNYPAREFREHPFNRVLISNDTHFLIHETQDPPVKPTDKEMTEFLEKHPFSTESTRDEPPSNGNLKGVKILFQNLSGNELVEEVIYVRCENSNGTNCFSPLVTRFKQRTPRNHRSGAVKPTPENIHQTVGGNGKRNNGNKPDEKKHTNQGGNGHCGNNGYRPKDKDTKRGNGHKQPYSSVKPEISTKLDHSPKKVVTPHNRFFTSGN